MCDSRLVLQDKRNLRPPRVETLSDSNRKAGFADSSSSQSGCVWVCGANKNHMADCKQSSYATMWDECTLPGGTVTHCEPSLAALHTGHCGRGAYLRPVGPAAGVGEAHPPTHLPTHHYQLFPLMWLMFPPALCCLFSRTDGGGKRGMLYKPVQSCNAKKKKKQQQNYKMSFIINQESCTTLQNLEDDKGRLGGGGEGGGKERGEKEGCWCWQKVAQQKNGGRNATQPGVNHNYNNVAFAFQKLGDHTV